MPTYGFKKSESQHIMLFLLSIFERLKYEVEDGKYKNIGEAVDVEIRNIDKRLENKDNPTVATHLLQLTRDFCLLVKQTDLNRLSIEPIMAKICTDIENVEDGE